jgi:glycosyltransferase involved in cell wall biosynthesis
LTGRCLRVFMLDLLATVPYYSAYLTCALTKEDIDLTLGSISYYLDRTCFSSRGITVDPGFMDVVSRWNLQPIVRRPLKLLEALINQTALALRFRAAPPDVLHVQFLPMFTWRMPFDFWFLLFCRKRGIKVVLTVHDLLPHDTGFAHRDRFLKLYQSVDWIICHSAHIRARLASEFEVTPEKVSVIPHGPFFYDLNRSGGGRRVASDAAKPDGGVGVLWQGIIHPYKGVDLLLGAWHSVEVLGEDASLVVAGTGPAAVLDEIRQRAESLKLGRVTFILRFVSVTELIDLYDAAEIVVYPYRAISTSGALATGLALGKAIIASDLPVFREILEDRKTAILVDLENPEELTGALVELIRGRELRERLAANVRAMNFGEESWASIARQTMQVYRGLVDTTTLRPIIPGC